MRGHRFLTGGLGERVAGGLRDRRTTSTICRRTQERLSTASLIPSWHPSSARWGAARGVVRSGGKPVVVAHTFPRRAGAPTCLSRVGVQTGDLVDSWAGRTETCAEEVA